MKLFQRGFVRDPKLFKALSLGLKILRQGRELEQAVAISSSYYKVDKNKVRRYLIKWTGIQPANKRKDWPACNSCSKHGGTVKADFEIRLDRFYPDQKKSFEDIYGRNPHPETPYLCEACREALFPQGAVSLVPPEWDTIVEPIDKRLFRPWEEPLKKVG